ncbi:MAG TPA: cytochrome c oxidase subunit 3 [Azospirillum sp.]|nr:cytochrome c oxidase subunit 3 [Azospirillum sp.]
MTPRFVEDVSNLPTHSFGTRSIVWWGTLGFIAVEGMAFVLAAATYFYLAFAGGESRWPPTQDPPALWASSLFTLLLLASLWPNVWTKRKGEEENRRGSRIGLVVMLVIGLALIGVRVLEWGTLNCRWDDSAYGSIVWVLLGLHTLHLITDVGDSAVLTALMFTRHAHGRRFSDVAENAMYWNFVVLSWLPIYAVLYLVPRLI